MKTTTTATTNEATRARIERIIARLTTAFVIRRAEGRPIAHLYPRSRKLTALYLSLADYNQ